MGFHPHPPLPLPWGLFPGPNTQVTFDQNRPYSGSRSESDLAVDPSNPNVMISASKRFIDNQQYKFTTATSWSTDGGSSWTDSSDLWLDHNDNWMGYTDPALAYSIDSNAFLISEPDVFVGGAESVQGRGMIVFRSGNGGMSWQVPPTTLDVDSLDDKQWAAADNVSSSYKGNVYACWGANTPLGFARSTDGGNSWSGIGGSAPGTAVTEESVFAPAMCVSSDGTIHIAWIVPDTSFIRYVESTDGGNSFSSPQTVVDGITDITSTFPSGDPLSTEGFPVFPGGTFRVMTLATIAPLGARGCVIAWADCRGPYTRIYYRVRDSGGTWVGDPSGQPVLANMKFPDSTPVQHFHPQLAVNQSGLVGCAFYEFGQKPPDNAYRIDVKLASTYFFGQSPLPVEFVFWCTVTDHAWDPSIDAPWSHGDSKITFIGEYFGMEASGDDFCALWTDTRTGKQELWFSRVATWRPAPARPPVIAPSIVGEILYGVAGDGGGVVLVNGIPIPVPPMGPVRELLPLLAAYGIVMSTPSAEAARIGAEIMNAIVRISARYGTTAGLPGNAGGTSR